MTLGYHCAAHQKGKQSTGAIKKGKGFVFIFPAGPFRLNGGCLWFSFARFANFFCIKHVHEGFNRFRRCSAIAKK